MTRAQQRPTRYFLPLVAAAGITMSLTAPLEVLFVHDLSQSGFYIGTFMLTASLGVIVVDVFGNRFVPGIDARTALTAGLVMFGLACICMGLVRGGAPLMAARVLQGLGGGVMLGAGLQAAVRVAPVSDDVARSVGRFNTAFLFGGALGSPGGLLVTGFIEGRFGYQVAFVLTGMLALLVAGGLAVVLPHLDAPPGVPPPQIGLPRLARTPGSRCALVLAMMADFLRGGVLFTALPLAGAARDYPMLTITAGIAIMAGMEIVALAVAYRTIRRVGVVTMLVASLVLGSLCAVFLAVNPDPTTFLVVSALFGVSLAGATASLPVLVVAHVGDSAAGLAMFRISAGIGILCGSVGCAVLATQIGIGPLFGAIALILLGSALLARFVGVATA
ncbi:MFS transporter [Mycobacterium sp. LTG2003]